MHDLSVPGQLQLESSACAAWIMPRVLGISSVGSISSNIWSTSLDLRSRTLKLLSFIALATMLASANCIVGMVFANIIFMFPMTVSVRYFVSPESTHSHISVITWSRLLTCDLAQEVNYPMEVITFFLHTYSFLLCFGHISHCTGTGLRRGQPGWPLQKLSSEWWFLVPDLVFIGQLPNEHTLIITASLTASNHVTFF